ncbi:MAG TPA: hypothetical protein VEA69_02270 [Tepidisphaeraceae bacterium]|nr:hypothetical protein [Tepidisphaeraceae bacterium]
MVPPVPHLERFISAVRRRMVILRVLERVGVCALVGSLICLAIMGLRLWTGRAIGGVPAILMGASVVLGVVWGLWMRPGRLRAAAEADRQLELNDLLASAVATSLGSPIHAGAERTGFARSAAPDPSLETSFIAVVLSMADAATANVRLSSLRLHRLGARSWGGIGLSVALVGVLALLGSDPPKSRADTNAVALGPTSWQEQEDRRNADSATRLRSAPDLRRPRTGTGRDEDPNTGQVDTDTQTTTDPTPGATDGGNSQAGTSPSTGAGSATGTPTRPANPDQTTATNTSKPATPATGSHATTGATASGGTGSATTGQPTGAGGATGGASTGVRPAPPWRTAGWPDAKAAAQHAVAAGAIPDRYRDLVRDYFDRE